MVDFLEVNNNWFLKKYASVLGRRLWTFKIALGLFLQNGGESIVETGCIRTLNDWAAGYSTLVFADFCDRFNKHLSSIDNNSDNILVAKGVTDPFKKFVSFHLGDSVSVLAHWSDTIDLLYLDSVDCDPTSEEKSASAQVHQFREISVSFPKLSEKAVVLLDDNYFEGGGKTRLAKEYLSENDFINILDYEQSLWIRR